MLRINVSKILPYGGKYMTHLFSKLALAVLALAVAATVFLMTPACASKDTEAETLIKYMYQQTFKDRLSPDPFAFDNYIKEYGSSDFAYIWQCNIDHNLNIVGSPLNEFIWGPPPKEFEVKALPGTDLVTVTAKIGDDSISWVYVVRCGYGGCEISDYIYAPFGSAKYMISLTDPECSVIKGRTEN